MGTYDGGDEPSDGEERGCADEEERGCGGDEDDEDEGSIPAWLEARRTKTDTLLENENRADLFDQVERTPGVNMSVAARRTGVPHSTARFHLQRLEQGGVIVTKDGQGNERVCFLKCHEHLWENPKTKTRILFGGDAKRNVALFVAENPGSTLKEIADAIDCAPGTIRHHLKVLKDHGLVEALRIESADRFHPEPALVEWYREVGEGFERPWEQAER